MEILPTVLYEQAVCGAGRRNAVCAKTYIADDEQNIRELLQEFLKADYTVEIFETGDTPMQRFAAVPADLWWFWI